MLALEDTDVGGWTRTTLRVAVDDTVSMRDLNLYIRYDGTWAGGVLPLKIDARAPGGAWFQDRLTASLGSAGNGLREVRVPWRKGVVFPRHGVYTFSITGPDVSGIRAVGIVESACQHGADISNSANQKRTHVRGNKI